MNDKATVPPRQRGLNLRRLRADLPKMLAAISAAAAMSALPLTIFDDRNGQMRDFFSAADLSALQTQIHILAARNDELSRRVATVTQNKSGPVNFEYGLIEKRQVEISERLAELERVIMSNPAKTLEIPMMRRDIDSNKQSVTDSLNSMQHSIDRVYDQNKYLMITVTVSILLLAISSFLKPKGGG